MGGRLHLGGAAREEAAFPWQGLRRYAQNDCRKDRQPAHRGSGLVFLCLLQSPLCASSARRRFAHVRLQGHVSERAKKFLEGCRHLHPVFLLTCFGCFSFWFPSTRPLTRRGQAFLRQLRWTGKASTLPRASQPSTSSPSCLSSTPRSASPQLRCVLLPLRGRPAPSVVRAMTGGFFVC